VLWRGAKVMRVGASPAKSLEGHPAREKVKEEAVKLPTDRYANVAW